MKKFLASGILLIISTFFMLNFDSYSNENSALSKTDKKNMGDKNLVLCKFPKKWPVLGETDDQNPNFKIKSLNKGYDTIMYFLGKHYNNLYNEFKIDKKKTIKASFFTDLTKLKNKETNVKIADAYFVKTIKNPHNITIDLYKDGGTFNSYATSEDSKVVNYLGLVVKSLEGKIIGQKIIYYNCKNIIETEASYFYLADDLSLVIKKFYTDETDHYYKGNENYHITNKGIKTHE